MGSRLRNRESAIAERIGQLVALLLLVIIFAPAIRKLPLTLGIILTIAVLAIAVALGVMFIRRTKRRSHFCDDVSVSLDVKSPVPIGPAGKVRLNGLVTPDSQSARPSLGNPTSKSSTRTQNPAELMSTAALVQQMHKIDWFQFEKLVELIYRKLGYTVIRRRGVNPDGGIDLVIEKDNQRTAVQCKQWKTWKVGVKAVREFLGALTDARIAQGMLITLRGSSGQARKLADKHGIKIVDEMGLSELIEEANAQRDPATLALLRDSRKFCPKCGREMVPRTAKKGRGAGQRFWGCSGYSGYPRCRFTLPWSEEDHLPPSSRQPGKCSIRNLTNRHTPCDLATHKASA